ncbi:hypothetical protein BKP35_05355 [Anaerobacillus arseniciselenatis]|uniref:CBS domain-containing protein n=1 Tax=Anaerobacillus arseniciselenatis TaxID=85682 RepID=A0A1S2LV82_9BACI|nr:CBS domain-containing protein [Anaerobacillus arseniciselenatis]OIJ15275.1 hypothetical protein BKP35_05355 [Anaerobacillus arseniciselenatis]
MRNSERFILAYNAITKELEKMLQIKKYVPFHQLLEMAKKKNGVIEHYLNDLRDITYLRNAIVHDKNYPETAIAEPHTHIVEKLEHILKEIQKPQKVIPLFKKDVKTLKATSTLSEVLHLMKSYSYTQFPAFNDNQFVGLITDRSIVRWMAQNIDDIEVKIRKDDIKVSDILFVQKEKKNVVFVDKNQNLFDIQQKFLNHRDQYLTRLEAVLITETGDPLEKLLGIITPFDLLQTNSFKCY